MGGAGARDARALQEARRLELLRSYDVLDTWQEEAFDRITRMVATLLDVPIVLVSLVDAERQWFKARLGLQAKETRRDISFCTHAIQQDEVFIVEDAAADPRFADNPLVTAEPHIRFYAGAPLTVAEGMRLGTLCAIDHRPRQLTDEQVGLLRDFAAMVVDALENRRAARRARDAETLLHDAIESLSDGFVVYDADDRLLLCNQRYREIYAETAKNIEVGRTFEELLRRGVANGQYPEAVGREEDWLAERLEAHRNPGAPVEQRLPGDRWVRIEEQRTRSGGLVGFRVDITELKRQQRELQSLAETLEIQLARAEEASRAKMQFLASVSHELRTPLNAVIGFADVLGQELFGPLGAPRYREYCGDIRTSAQHLLALVDDILDMAKLSSGKFVLVAEDLDLAPTLAEAAKIVAVPVQDKNLTFQVTCAPETLGVRADLRALRQLLFNLASNAAKFTPTGGRVELRAAAEGQWVRIEVADTGIGIPEDLLPHLGQPFQRVGNVMTSSASGSGLGLAIAKAMAEAMGGKLEIDSRLGEGTTVSVVLPRA